MLEAVEFCAWDTVEKYYANSSEDWKTTDAHPYSQVFDRADKKFAGVAVADANRFVVPA